MRNLLGELIPSQHYEIEFYWIEKKITNTVRRSFWEWKLLEEIIQEQKSLREIIFMEMDSYLVLLVTKRFKKYNLAVKEFYFNLIYTLKKTLRRFSFFT
jgi:hypothetical protein